MTGLYKNLRALVTKRPANIVIIVRFSKIGQVIFEDYIYSTMSIPHTQSNHNSFFRLRSRKTISTEIIIIVMIITQFHGLSQGMMGRATFIP